MEKRPSGTRYKFYDQWDYVKNENYDYEKNGILNKIISHQISESKNEILQIILQYYEQTFIFLMKYIDKLKNFKNCGLKNR